MEHLKRLGYYLRVLTCVKQYKGYWVKIEHIITIVICGIFCGLTSLEEIHDYANSKPVKEMLRKTFKIYRIPSYSHFVRLLRRIDKDELNESFRCWCHWILTDINKKVTISMDGKAIKSTANMQSYERPLHIISAVIAEYGITIGQLAVESKKNEIPAVQELIKTLDIKGTVVTADALNCQKKTAKLIVEKGANYVLPVKRNHNNLYFDIEEIFKYILNNKVEKHKNEYKKNIIKTCEKNRDRVETRTACVLYDIEWLEEKNKWEKLTAIGMVKLKKSIKIK